MLLMYAFFKITGWGQRTKDRKIVDPTKKGVDKAQEVYENSDLKGKTIVEPKAKPKKEWGAFIREWKCINREVELYIFNYL